MSSCLRPPEELRVLGVDLSPLSSAGRFLVCAAGVFVFFLLHGYLQELIFSLDGFRPFGWYLTLVQFGLYSLFGLLERRLTREEDGGRRRRAGAGGGGVPAGTYVIVALLTVASMGLVNTSLGYLSYPTLMVCKSCKLLSVMAGAALIQGKRYGLADTSAALCMTLGLAWFALADRRVASGGLDGLPLVAASLCADAAIGNVQEKALRLHGGSNADMLLYSYSIGFPCILAGLCAAGGLVLAVAFCWEHRPGRTYGYMFLMSLSGYLGVSFVLALVKHFGALAATTVTTGRKVATVVLSFLVFAKPFTLQYVWGGLLVLLGIYLNRNGRNTNNMKLTAV